MCEHCKSLMENTKTKKLSLNQIQRMKTLGWKLNEEYVIDSGFAVTKGKNTIVVNDKVAILYDEKMDEIDYFECVNHDLNLIKVFDNRIKTKYYEIFKENIQKKLCEVRKGMPKVKIWTIFADDHLLCQGCRQLNGVSKSMWALFFITFISKKGRKTYSMEGPPLHFYQAGPRKGQGNCRCHLEYSTDKNLLFDSKEVIVNVTK